MDMTDPRSAYGAPAEPDPRPPLGCTGCRRSGWHFGTLENFRV